MHSGIASVPRIRATPVGNHKARNKKANLWQQISSWEVMEIRAETSRGGKLECQPTTTGTGFRYGDGASASY
jgi:hypothetical protein